MILGGVEAGGTKWVCAVGSGPDDIRESVWGGASVQNRIGSVLSMADTFHLIDLGSEKDLLALDLRLNQNVFVGIAASRLQDKEVDYLNGQSVWDGVMSMVPRALWPDKPITGGSGRIVADVTGLDWERAGVGPRTAPSSSDPPLGSAGSGGKSSRARCRGGAARRAPVHRRRG